MLTTMTPKTITLFCAGACSADRRFKLFTDDAGHTKGRCTKCGYSRYVAPKIAAAMRADNRTKPGDDSDD
jgi:hypothetical protein